MGVEWASPADSFGMQVRRFGEDELRYTRRRIAEKYPVCQLLSWYRSNEMWKNRRNPHARRVEHGAPDTQNLPARLACTTRRIKAAEKPRFGFYLAATLSSQGNDRFESNLLGMEVPCSCHSLRIFGPSGSGYANRRS